MNSFCIGVLSGALLSLFLPIVPPFFAVFLLLAINFILLKYRKLFFAGVLSFICSWHWQFHQYEKAQQWLLASNHTVSGEIITPVRQFAEYSQFQLQLENAEAKDFKIQLTWRLPPTQPEMGQRWRITANFRPVAGVANPGGFNTEAQALLTDVLAQGRVIDEQPSELLSKGYSWRDYLQQRVKHSTAGLPSAPLLIALTIGEREFSESLWRGVQHSGLAHLLAISGLHIGLVFGWCLFLMKHLPWPIKYQHWQLATAICVALSAAIVYAWLSGFAIPTVRATVALSIFALAWLQHKRVSFCQYWLLLAAVLLLAEPAFVLSKSFWLSMLAVAVIFLLLWRYPIKRRGWQATLWQFFRFHLLLTFFMSLLSVLMFDGTSNLSLVSNILFVPWCTFVAIPLLFTALLTELLMLPGSALLWRLADVVFTPLLHWLQWCANYDSWLALPDIPPLLVVILLGLFFVGFILQRRFVIWLLPVVALPVVAILAKPAQWQLHVIDVGQGLAVLLQHGNRGLLYDAGPRYGAHSATASQVLPFLRRHGVKQLETIILSHNDSDHSGDWRLLRQYYPNAALYTDITAANATGSCADIPATFLTARLKRLHTGRLYDNTNDNSCVVLLEVLGWHILLPGDISSSVEREILARYPELDVDVLVLAHHGSNSSSHLTFLHQLSPVWLLNSASLYNRHNHPSTEVLTRSRMLDIPLFNTAQHGAISLNISPETLHLTTYRQQRIPFWLQKPVGNAETSRTTR